ncbi:DsbA family protein [Candidatus Saccharibacteria bacterium]|nr:DsbA family protein [Candidatus Saccharibacteria bacterium]
MNKVGWIIFSVVVVVLLGGLVVWTRITNPPIDVSSVDAATVQSASVQSGDIADHTLGKTDSKVVLIEYGDYQCPSCQNAAPHVTELTDEYADSIVFVFRNFPLSSIHPNARAASAAAEAAGIQGKFWEMHDLLYENHEAWETQDATQRTNTFKLYAESLGLDIARFEADMSGARVTDKISFDQALGKKQSVDATPTFILNGEKLDSDASSGIVQGDLTAIKAKLDSLLAQ